MQLLSSLDSALLSWLLSLPHPASVDSMMRGLSAIGSNAAVWLFLAALLAMFRPASAMGAWQVVLAVVLTFIVVDAVLKPIVGRARPARVAARIEARIAVPDTASFPSGHAASAFAGGYALSRVFPGARVALWTLALLIACSRLYLGVHYPLDVMAGALVGLGCGAFVVGGSVWYSCDPAARVFHVPR